ncbi:MAG TPA: ABC transporter ATP-binding protein [Candidatus Competibacteraceae bacterium]|nr:ABC transporter ATP-binding protein [Candidatus Competibacteraceae bacterium]
MDALLKIRDLEVDFRLHDMLVPAIRGISFSIRPGATVALVGESGSGKSVTAQAIMGILPENAVIKCGEILLADPEQPGQPLDIAQTPPRSPTMRAIRGGRISMIFQEPMVSLSPLHTIGDQVSEALYLHRPGFDRRQGVELTEDMLRLVGFPDPKRALHTYPFELSGGLRQRAMIAMALICHPALLIADEPTTALDVSIQAQILKLLKDLQAELGMALLIITHDLGVVANLAEEVVVMYRGRIMESGRIEDVFTDPGHPYLRGLLRAIPHFDMHPGERLVPLRSVRWEISPTWRSAPPWPPEAKAAGPHLRLEGVCKSFDGREHGLWRRGPGHAIKVVDRVSLEVRPGECLGLVGESGCGKTTLSKMIMAAIRADEGRIVFNDRGKLIDVLNLDEAGLLAYRRRMQFIFQDPYGSLNPRLPVSEILREPLVIHGIGDAASQCETARELMRLVGLDPRFLNRYPHSFSGGQRQRIGIARALALRPDFLICDEPVSALDVSVQAQILNLLEDLQRELGLTVLFISHNLAVVDYVADRIAVMCRGRIVEVAPREILFRDPVHPYTRALLAAVPYADLSRKLDFAAVLEGAASDPAAWRPPFTLDGKTPHELLSLGGDHYVRIHLDADPALLRP